jgi:hypothetical protein
MTIDYGTDGTVWFEWGEERPDDLVEPDQLEEYQAYAADGLGTLCQNVCRERWTWDWDTEQWLNPSGDPG